MLTVAGIKQGSAYKEWVCILPVLNVNSITVGMESVNVTFAGAPLVLTKFDFKDQSSGGVLLRPGLRIGIIQKHQIGLLSTANAESPCCSLRAGQKTPFTF